MTKLITPKTPEGAELIALLQKHFGVPEFFNGCTVRIGAHNEPILVSLEYAPRCAPQKAAE